MSEPTSEFADLLEKARNGDQAALDELSRQYEAEVRLVARVQLGPALRPYLDSVDLVQSVHRSLLIGLRNRSIDISSPQHLVALALTMVRRKVARHWRRMQRQERLSFVGTEDQLLPPLLASLCTGGHDPAEAAVLRDSLQHLWAHLDATERQVMELRLQGHSTAAVARELKMDPDVLRVRLSRLRQRLRGAGVLTEWL